MRPTRNGDLFLENQFKCGKSRHRRSMFEPQTACSASDKRRASHFKAETPPQHSPNAAIVHRLPRLCTIRHCRLPSWTDEYHSLVTAEVVDSDLVRIMRRPAFTLNLTPNQSQRRPLPKSPSGGPTLNLPVNIPLNIALCA